MLDTSGGYRDAEACSDETHRGEPLGGFLNDARAEAVLLAERDRLLVGTLAGGGGEEDEGLVAQVGGGDDMPGCEGVVSGQNGYEGFAEDSSDVEAVSWVAIAEEAGVECAVEQTLYDDGGVGLVELEVHPGEGAAILAEHGGQRDEHAGADEAYAEEAFFATTYAAGFGEIFMYVAQRAAGTVEEDVTSAGELDCAGGADEEGIAENLFELADLLGQGRLGEMEAVRGMAKVKFLCHGDEVAEMAKL